MHQTSVPSFLRDRTALATGPSWAAAAMGIAGAAFLLVAVLLGWRADDGWARFLHAYLVNHVFLLSISLGALFFVLLHHVTRAGWSVSIRRLMEILCGNMLLLAALFLPILLALLMGSHAIYPWNDPAVMAENPVVGHKAGYLNVPFFVARGAGYFVIWWLLSRFYVGRSYEQDRTGDLTITTRLESLSGPGLILFSFTVTFAAFDWLMSLDPDWFSTIYGVYFFAGTTVAALSAVILLAVGLQAAGLLRESITVEHYHDLGKLLFAFVVFWGYIAFSQYMLIWYANLPEETQYYMVRQEGAWAGVSLALLLGHLVVPFFGLISRHVKRRKPLLAFWAAWVLVFHWLDMYWLVMPNHSPKRPPLGAIDAFLLAGLGLVFAAATFRLARSGALLPLRDPRLGEALAFENV